MAKGKKMKKNKMIIIVIVAIVLLLGGTYIFIKLNPFGNDKLKELGYQIDNLLKQESPKIEAVDLDSNARPYGVMIDNQSAARPHSGLQSAYLTYEIIVEGGITRLFAIFKDVEVNKIGPVRSSRHYFLDYAMENDAIYAHFGWSPYAQEDISTYKINNLNGLYNPSNMYWRNNENNHYAPHNAYTSTKNIIKAAENKGYSLTSDNYQVLNYTARELDYSKNQDAIVANEISIPYSYIAVTSYTYDNENKVYLRSVNGKAHTDAETKKQYTVKNIIVIEDIYNETIDSKGRQDIENIGSGTGKYISNGYAIPIKWEKKNRQAKTVYTTLDGKELKINDGNTYIQIQSKGQKLTIK